MNKEISILAKLMQAYNQSHFSKYIQDEEVIESNCDKCKGSGLCKGDIVCHKDFEAGECVKVVLDETLFVESFEELMGDIMDILVENQPNIEPCLTSCNDSERRCVEQEREDKKLKNNNLNLLKKMRCLISCNDSECDTNGCKKIEITRI